MSAYFCQASVTAVFSGVWSTVQPADRVVCFFLEAAAFAATACCYHTGLSELGAGGRAQCVELKLRWRFCGHGSICTEIYL